jgi:hypothetical protein
MPSDRDLLGVVVDGKVTDAQAFDLVEFSYKKIALLLRENGMTSVIGSMKYRSHSTSLVVASIVSPPHRGVRRSRLRAV